MRPLADFRNAHAGQVAYVYGKGPGLDFFDRGRNDGVNICVNEAALVLSHPHYVFANDDGPIMHLAAAWPPGCILISYDGAMPTVQASGIPDDCVVCYQCIKFHIFTRRKRHLCPDEVAKGLLLGWSSTVHQAIHFCWFIGAERIVVVGCDGGHGLAQCVDLPQPPPRNRKYIRFHEHTTKILDAVGLPYEFYVPLS